MSGLAILFHRDGRPVAAGEIEPVLDAMGERGPHGRRVALAGAAALGHLHHWTTPEEVGERQPLADSSGRWLVAFDGRIDNRPEMLARFGDGLATGCSDAALVLAGLVAEGDGMVERLRGPFALVAWDAAERRALLAVDAMGSRGLVFHLGRRRLLAASEERGLVGGGGVAAAADEARLDLHFALREPTDDATFFRDVRTVLPGEVVEVDASRHRRRRAAPVEVGLAPPPRGESAAALREALERSVACRLRAAAPAGVMLSGGLDSTAVATLGAASVGGRALPVFSWRFRRRPECDEGAYIDATAAVARLARHRVPGDDGWPRAGSTVVAAGGPPQNPYRELLEATFRAAAGEGVGVLLTGMYGDQLYTGHGQPTPRSWLRRTLAAVSRGGDTHAGALRRWLRGGGLLVPRLRPVPWLRGEVRRRLPDDPPWPPEAIVARRPLQAVRLLDLRNVEDLRAEAALAARHRLEMRHPCRDRRVVELLLSLPASDLRRGDLRRPVLRAAVADLLPAAVHGRRDKTSFVPLVAEGLFGRGRREAESVLWSAEREWPRWVREDWLRERWRARDLDGEGGLVVWQCVAFEMWRRRGRGGGRGDAAPDARVAVAAASPARQADAESRR